MTPSRVCVGTTGRFWLFALARELEERGMLKALYSGYPRWKVDAVRTDSVQTYPWYTLLYHGLERVGLPDLARRTAYRGMTAFDRWMADRLEPCDVLQCLSGCGLESHRRAGEEFGAATICDRGSTHIRYQDRLLAEEHARWNVDYQPIDSRIIAREEAEYDQADAITVPSEFVRGSFVEEGVPRERVYKVPYGVNLDLFQPIEKEDDVFRVLFVGRIGIRKGIPYLLEAIAELDDDGFELWLIGGKESGIDSTLKQYEGLFKYKGLLPRTELSWYYSQGSVMVLPSIEEGLALVQAQAMACGVPVIATPNTGSEDLFTDGKEGFIVPPRDPKAIRDKIAFLRDNPDKRDEMAKAALARVTELGGWDTYGQRMVEIYRELVGSLG